MYVPITQRGGVVEDAGEAKAVADPGFGTNLKGGANPFYYLVKFHRKLHENEEN